MVFLVFFLFSGSKSNRDVTVDERTRLEKEREEIPSDYYQRISMFERKERKIKSQKRRKARK